MGEGGVVEWKSLESVVLLNPLFQVRGMEREGRGNRRVGKGGRVASAHAWRGSLLTGQLVDGAAC
jgi:hypothetical protein